MTDSDIQAKVADKIEAVADEDLILECRMKPAGALCWRIPHDLKTACFMYRMLYKEVKKAEEQGQDVELKADTEAILECRMKPDKTLHYRIPQDSKRAYFMLRVLDTGITEMLKASIIIKQPKITVPHSKIIVPGKVN